VCPPWCAAMIAVCKWRSDQRPPETTLRNGFFPKDLPSIVT
jgi:hypothetical protein